MAIRVAACLLALSACGASNAQAPGHNPLDPTGFPIPLPRDLRLPPPLTETIEFTFEAEEWEVVGNTFTGRVVNFDYRGYRVRADEAVGDLESDRFALRGNVNVLGQDHVVRGNTVVVDFRARTFRFENGEVDLREALFQGRVRGDVYVTAETVEGSSERVVAHVCTVTTCDLTVPHYSIECGTLIAEQDRLVFENMRLRILGRTVLALPRFVLPLDRDYLNMVPEVGSATEEGQYARFRFGIPIGADTAVARLDLMSERGLGLGVDYDFGEQISGGEVRAYLNTLSPVGRPSGFTASGRYGHNFGWAQIEASQDYRQDSYLLPGSTTAQTRLRLTPNQGPGAVTNLFYNLTDSRSPGFASVLSNLALSDVRSIVSGLRTNLQLNLAESRSESGGLVVVSRRALDTRMNASYDMHSGVIDLDYQRQVPIGETLGFVGGLDRTPELTFRTDSRRLAGLIPWLPEFRALVSIGNYRDNFNDINVARYFFDFRTTRVSPLRDGFTFNYDLGFRQGIYTDGSAQYTPTANLLFRYQLPARLSANLRYNYSRQHGFTPIQADRSGQFDTTSFDIMGEVARGLALGGQVGFDFNRQRRGLIGWQSPSMRLEYRPADWFRFRGLANYIPQNNRWGNVRMDVSWRAGGTFVGAAARYDGINNRWGNLNLFVDALTWGRLKVTTLLLYNGYQQRFDSRQLSLTWDMHCSEAILQIIENNIGFQPGRQILFFIRLKAFPSNTGFGTGGIGQPMDIGTGRDW